MSQIKNTKWQMAYQVQDVVELPETDWLQEYGGLAAYKHKSIPQYSSSNWQDAPLEDGNLNFMKDSRIPGGYKDKKPWKYVDFTYFRTIVQIPAGATINSFKVIINKVDDGARIYLFNNKHKDGIHTNQDGKLQGDKVTADFSSLVAEGQNTIVIAQFDNNPTLNTLTGGIDIMINDQKIETDPTLPVPIDSGIEWKYYWAENIVKSSDNKKATGEVNGNGFTFTTYDPITDIQRDVETKDGLYSYNKFASQKAVPSIPNSKNIMNQFSSKNKLTFAKKVHDPIIVFASIGSSGTPVPVKFENEIQILWQENVTVSGHTITGTEGYAIIQISGDHDEIKFEYLADEYYVNFFFGYKE